MKNDKVFGERREFLATGISAFLLLNFTGSIELFSQIKGKKHPYLLFEESDLSRIKANTESDIMKDYWKSLLNTDLDQDYKFFNEEIDFNRHSPHLGKTSIILLRSSFLALMTGEKKFLSLALLAVDKLLGFKEWDFFTEGGDKIIGFNSAPNAIHAMSFAYDWLFDHLTEEKRNIILKAIEERGAEACYLSLFGMRHPDKVKGWDLLSTTKNVNKVDYTNWPKIFNTNNIKITALAGLVIGYSLLQSEGKRNEKFIDMIKWGMSTSYTPFNKDGSFDEGIPYWAYTMYFYTLAVECCKRHLGLNYMNVIDFRKNSEFIATMITPATIDRNMYVNFCDGGMNVSYSACFWIASRFKDQLAQHIAENYSANQDIFSIINYNRLIKSKQPFKRLLDTQTETGWVISRSGFTIDDTVVAFRSGRPVNHEHADRNSFILNAFGERLLNDPFEAGYWPKDKKWNLRLTSAHNAILIDGSGHQYHDGREGTNASKAEAKILEYDYSDLHSALSSDATQAYKLVNNDVRKVVRSLLFVKPDILIVIDNLEKESIDSQFSARFQIFNRDSMGKSEINGNNSFTIIRPNAKLIADIFNSDGELKEGKLDVPDSFIPHPFVDHTKDKPVGLSAHPFVEFLTSPSKKSEIITFFRITGKDNNLVTKPDFNKTGNNYSFRFKRMNKETSVKFELDNYKLINVKINK